MTPTSKSVKLFNLQERKNATGTVTEVDIYQWKNTLIDNLKRETDYAEHCLPTSRWGLEKTPNRGFEDEIEGDGTARLKADQVDSMLTKIASYAPKSIVREIIRRTTKLEDIWSVAKDWAGIKSTGTKHLEYFKVKKSYQKWDKEESPQEYFYRLRDAMEDTLIRREDNIREHGKLVIEQEEMTPTINSIVVLDWLEAIGGPQLIEHIHRIYATDLENVTLASLQNKIWKNLPALLHEIEESQELQISQCNAHEKGVCRQVTSYRNQNKFEKPFMRNKQFSKKPRGKSYTSQPSQRQNKKFCKLCKASGSQSFRSHDLSECWLITDVERNAIAQAAAKANALFACDEEQSSNNDFIQEETEEEL